VSSDAASAAFALSSEKKGFLMLTSSFAAAAAEALAALAPITAAKVGVSGPRARCIEDIASLANAAQKFDRGARNDLRWPSTGTYFVPTAAPRVPERVPHFLVLST